MASIGHVAVGVAAARVYRGRRPARVPLVAAMLWWSALSFLPDADVLGFRFGVAYGDEWGHRGASHSLFFALGLGASIGVIARWFGFAALRTGLVATVVLASHGLLDSLTDGGLGCALLWPFELERYFAPWRPIPVAPIGLGFYGMRGLQVALVELLLFAPVFAYAFWPRRLR